MAQQLMSRDKLYLNEDTDRDDVLEFLLERLRNPVVSGDVVIWNFSNNELDREALTDFIERTDEGLFVVTYQVSGVWPYMARILPRALCPQAQILAYRQSTQRYVAYDNFNDDLGKREFEDRWRLQQELESLDIAWGDG